MHLPQDYTNASYVITPLTGQMAKDRGSGGQVRRLLKSLYGLKKALRQWFAKLSSALMRFDYV